MLFIKEASHAREISRTIMHLCWIIYDHKSLLWSVSPNPPGGGASINTHIRSRMVFILSGAIPRGILPLVAGSPALTSTSAGGNWTLADSAPGDGFRKPERVCYLCGTRPPQLSPAASVDIAATLVSAVDGTIKIVLHINQALMISVQA